MTVDELGRIVAAYQQARRGSERVVVRGYEGGVDDVDLVVDAVILPDRDEALYYGPHKVVRAGVTPSRQIPPVGEGDVEPPRERVVWLIGSRDIDDVDGRIDPEGSGW